MSVAFEAVPSLRDKVTEDEWTARVNLAALYRLVAHNGWDDLIFTHISLRVPGPDQHFLINPYGMLFGEMTASSLVKVDIKGDIVMESPYFINPAGFTIHAPFHQTRNDAHCVLHLHTNAGIAVSAQKDGLLPISQHALGVMKDLAYHDYEGVALDHDECDRLLADMGDKSFMILRNHGTLTVGKTAADAYMRMYYLERSCQMQIQAQAGGATLIHRGDLADRVSDQVSPAFSGPGGDLVWPALLRMLDKEDASYRN